MGCHMALFEVPAQQLLIIKYEEAATQIADLGTTIHAYRL